MLSGMEWYRRLLIIIIFVDIIPLKVKWVKWWSRRQQEKQNNRRGKWGDEDD